MTIDRQKLKALAEAMPELDWDSQFEGHDQTGFCTVYGKPFEIDGQEHEGPTYVERCTAEQAEFVAGAKEVVLALLEENDQLREAHGQVCLNYNRVSFVAGERREEIERLKSKNEALRTGQAIKRLSGHEVREAFNGAYYQARDIGSDGEQCRAGVLAVIEAAMAKEASRDC